MEQSPKKEEISYENALHFAERKENEFAWMMARMWTLEDLIISTVSIRYGNDEKKLKQFELDLKKNLTLNSLFELAKKYNVTVDTADLEYKSLKRFYSIRKNQNQTP